MNQEEFAELISTVACGLELSNGADQRALCAAFNAAQAAMRKDMVDWLEEAQAALEAELEASGEDFDADTVTSGGPDDI